jgi:hypothetical protein
MQLFLKTVTLLLPFSCLVSAQSWEVGAAGGYGVYRKVSVTSGSASGTTGFDSGIAAGAVFGNQMNRFASGEVRYTFRKDDLKVTSGSTKATAGAQSHAIHYDVLVHATKKESMVRPFLAAGAGVKIYRGTGAEPPFQPLSNLVVLTHDTEARPMLSLGGGVKIAVSRRALFRLDFRDYATPIPDNLLATPPNSRLGGWMHDFVFLVGISTVF